MPAGAQERAAGFEVTPTGYDMLPGSRGLLDDDSIGVLCDVFGGHHRVTTFRKQTARRHADRTAWSETGASRLANPNFRLCG